MSDTSSPVSTIATSEQGDEQATVPAMVDPVGKPVERPVLDPTRYGDWEKNGRCIDF